MAQTPKGPSALGGRTPRGSNAHFRPPPATPRSVLRRGLMLTPRQGGAGGGPALTRPLALAVRLFQHFEAGHDRGPVRAFFLQCATQSGTLQSSPLCEVHILGCDHRVCTTLVSGPCLSHAATSPCCPSLQEICARVDIQLHEHMRVPRPSLGGNLGIDAPPADLKVLLLPTY